MECIHQPEVQPGQRCECDDCRKARGRAYDYISAECNRCAGRTGTDHEGQFTCAKGDFDCCILDLWHGILVREIEPEAVNPMTPVVIHEGGKSVTRRDRIPGDAPFDSAKVRDHRVSVHTHSPVQQQSKRSRRKR